MPQLDFNDVTIQGCKYPELVGDGYFLWSEALLNFPIVMKEKQTKNGLRLMITFIRINSVKSALETLQKIWCKTTI